MRGTLRLLLVAATLAAAALAPAAAEASPIWFAQTGSLLAQPSPDQAVLSGALKVVSVDGCATGTAPQYFFEYGVGDASGASAVALAPAAPADVPAAVLTDPSQSHGVDSGRIDGLLAGKTYAYRVVMTCSPSDASAAAPRVDGEWETFSTPALQIASTSAPLASGRLVRSRIACAASAAGSCRVRITLRAGAAGRVIGRRSVTLQPGQTRTIFTYVHRRLLPHSSTRVRVRLLLSSSDGFGPRSPISRTVYVRAV